MVEPSAFLTATNPFLLSQVTFTPLHVAWSGQTVHLLLNKYLSPLQAQVTAPFLSVEASKPLLHVTEVVPSQVALAGQAAHDLSVKRYCAFVQSWMQLPFLSFLNPVWQVYVVVPVQTAFLGQDVHLPFLINLPVQVHTVEPSVFLPWVNPFLVSQVAFTPLHVACSGQAVHLSLTKYLLPLQLQLTVPFLPATASYPALHVTEAVPLHEA